MKDFPVEKPLYKWGRHALKGVSTNEISEKTLQCLKPLSYGESAIIQSECLGEVLYEFGSTGRHGHGLLHIIEKRMREGYCLEDAVNVAIAVAESVASGKLTNSIKNTRHLDKGRIRAIVAINTLNKIVVTGYEIRNEGETTATKQRPADYASTPYVRSEQMVASFNYRLNQLLGKGKCMTKPTS